MRTIVAALAVAACAGSLTADVSDAVGDARATSFGTRGTIVALAADGRRVALATTGVRRSCDRIIVWNAPGKTFSRIDARTHCPRGESPSGGESLREIALAGTRVAWVESVAGNLQSLLLWTATLGSTRRTQLAFAENEAGAAEGVDGAYVGDLFADGPLLAYDTYELTNGGGSIGRSRLWTVMGGKKRAVRSGPDTTFVVAVDAGRIAVDDGLGTLYVYDRGGKPLKKLALGSRLNDGIAFQGSRVVSLRNGSLELYDIGTGSLERTLELPGAKGAKLLDMEDGLVVYVQNRETHVVRLSDGENIAFTAPARSVDAAIETAGLFYAYNRPSTTAPGHVVFVPLAELRRRLG